MVVVAQKKDLIVERLAVAFRRKPLLLHECKAAPVALIAFATGWL